MALRLLVPALALALATAPADARRSGAASAETRPFGQLPNGGSVSIHRLTNQRGMVVELIDYGASIARIALPDPSGRMAEMVVGPSDLQGFVTGKRRFGAIVGRYAGRLRGAALVDGVSYPLAANGSGVTLHGGDPGFDRALWSAKPFEDRNSVGVVFTHISREGDQGFPGTLRVVSRYSLARRANALTLAIEATSDRATAANLTNHVYFNLAGGGTIAGHRLQVDADRRVALDARKLPTGALPPTRDFAAPRSLAEAIRSSGTAGGVDEMLVLRKAGRTILSDPSSGRSLTVTTNQPGMQVFTGNAFDGTDRDRLGRPIERHHGVALEPGHFPDSPWIAHFPSTRVAPGRPLRWRTRWEFDSGAPTADHALLGQSFAAAATDEAARADVIARAREALGRPPGAIPRLHTEGTLPGKGIRDISIKAKRDHPTALDLALAWRLTGERAFLDQAASYLDAWASVYRMSFNPIDETGFDALAMAYDLTEKDLPTSTRSTMDAFWRRMAEGYLNEMDGSPRNANTNWQSHRIKLATIAAYQTGDRSLVARARTAFRKQIILNLRPDGSTFDFEERDALHYVTYNLDPLMMAALAAKAHGEDWFGWRSPTGSSLPRSLHWLAQFARGTRTHIEFANSKIAFDRERAAAGQKEFAPQPWNPGKSVGTFALASLLDPRYRELRDRLIASTGRRPPIWTALAN